MTYSMSVRLYFQGENPDWVLGNFLAVRVVKYVNRCPMVVQNPS